jgi:hypothetical protein
MYSAWKAAWVTGLGLFGAGVIYAIISTEFLSGSVGGAEMRKALGLTLIAFGVYGAAVALAVRVGLHLAGCRGLRRRSAMLIPLVYLVVAGLAFSIPIRTHAVLIPATDSATLSGMSVAVAVVRAIGVVMLPMGISFIVGRRSQARLSS